MESERPIWFTEHWMDHLLTNYEHDFDKALQRWRSLYKQAQTQIEEASLVINNRIYGENSKEKRDAHMKQLRGESLRDMLLGVNQGKNKEENEFYPYRYLASEDSCLAITLLSCHNVHCYSISQIRWNISAVQSVLH